MTEVRHNNSELKDLPARQGQPHTVPSPLSSSLPSRESAFIDRFGLCPFLKTRNSYIGLRHEEARSNQGKILVSSPASDGPHYGLTDAGERRAIARAQCFAEWTHLAEIAAEHRLLVLSSERVRAQETAAHFAEAFGIRHTPIPELNERYYGQYDGTPEKNWELFHAHDIQSPNDPPFGGESQAELYTRTHKAIAEVEDTREGYVVFLVTHCDPLQAMQAHSRATSFPRHYSDPPHQQPRLGGGLLLSAGPDPALLHKRLALLLCSDNFDTLR